MSIRTLWVMTHLLLLPTVVTAQPATERVLLPVVLKQAVPGAYGSLWTTSLWITNTADRPVLIEPYDYGCGLAVCVQPPTPANTSFRPSSGALLPVPGIFMYVERGVADQVGFALRVQDISRQAETWGTELPVVREGDWRKSLTLLDVPLIPGFRMLLRLYGLHGDRVTPVRVRMFRIDPDVLHPHGALQDQFLRETVVSLLPITAYHPRPAPEQQVSTMLYPSYAQMSDVDIRADLDHVERVRIEVESLSADDPIWAFVAVTNDSTQHFTLVTPR